VIWAAVFLLCSKTEELCMAVGSPLFVSREECVYSVQKQGVQIVTLRYPEYRVLDWQCVSFGKTEV
jgi:hypothetical protein